MAFPATSVTTDAIAAVYTVLCSRGVFVVKVATLLTASYVTVPVIVLGTVFVTLDNRNEVSLIVAEFMDSLNVQVTDEITGTAVALLTGDVDRIVGEVLSGFSATCLLLQDKIASADRRNTSDIVNRFIIFRSFPDQTRLG
jgi:hypothetical protein